MSRLTQKGATGPLSLFQTSSETIATAPFSYSSTFAGERFDSADGREFVLVQNSTVALSAGKMVQSPAVIANHQDLAVTAFTAASSSTGLPAYVTVTLGATAVTVNQYAGGYLLVNSSTGAGQTLKIASHAAANASASLVVYLEDAPLTALTTSSKVCLSLNPYTNVIVNPATPTGKVIGAALYAIAASTSSTNVFGLVQTKGPIAVLNDGALTIGSAISPSNVVAGAVENGVIAQGFVGTAIQTGVDTEYRMVTLDL